MQHRDQEIRRIHADPAYGLLLAEGRSLSRDLGHVLPVTSSVELRACGGSKDGQLGKRSIGYTIGLRHLYVEATVYRLTLRTSGHTANQHRQYIHEEVELLIWSDRAGIE